MVWVAALRRAAYSGGGSTGCGRLGGGRRELRRLRLPPEPRAQASAARAMNAQASPRDGIGSLMAAECERFALRRRQRPALSPKGGRSPAGPRSPAGQTLAGLEAAVGLVDDVDPPFAAYDAVVAVATAQRLQGLRTFMILLRLFARGAEVVAVKVRGTYVRGPARQSPRSSDLAADSAPVRQAYTSAPAISTSPNSAATR